MDATTRARELMLPFPPSSPSIALFKDGELVHMLERHHIEGRVAGEIAQNLDTLYIYMIELLSNADDDREEIDILEPAVKSCQGRQMHVTGPWPSDTVFLKAKRGEVDAVVTMYHDQGQIAIKLMGFERGVTVAGGLPIPVATPAHGTAFDIAGQNKANVSATKQAFGLLLRMAKTHRAEQERTT